METFELIGKIRKNFRTRLEEKTGWGRNELILMFEECMSDALSEKKPRASGVPRWLVVQNQIQGYRSAIVTQQDVSDDWFRIDTEPGKVFRIVEAETERDACRIAGIIPE